MAYTPPSPGSIHAVLVDGYVPPASNSIHFVIGELSTLYGAGNIVAPVGVVGGSATVTLLAAGDVEERVGSIVGEAFSIVNIGAVVEPIPVVYAQGESDVEAVECIGVIVESVPKVRGLGESVVNVGRISEPTAIVTGSGVAQVVAYGRVYQPKGTITGTTVRGDNIGDGRVYQRIVVSGSATAPIVGRGIVRQSGEIAGVAEAIFILNGAGAVEQKTGEVSATATSHRVVTGNGSIYDRTPTVHGIANHLSMCIGRVRERIPAVSGRSGATTPFAYLQHPSETVVAGTTPPAASATLGFYRDQFTAADAEPEDVVLLEFNR